MRTRPPFPSSEVFCLGLHFESLLSPESHGDRTSVAWDAPGQGLFSRCLNNRHDRAESLWLSLHKVKYIDD